MNAKETWKNARGGGEGEVLIMDYLPTYGAGAKIQVASWYTNQYHHGK